MTMHKFMSLMPALDITKRMVVEVSEDTVADTIAFGTGLPAAGRRQRRQNRSRRAALAA